MALHRRTKNIFRFLIAPLCIGVLLIGSYFYFPFSFPQKAEASVVLLTSGTTWTVPSDWNNSNNSIEVIGGGGGGAPSSFSGQSAAGGGGGGGGAYSKISNLTLTPGASVNYTVGSGGGSATAGGDTYFCNSTSNCASIGGMAVQVGAKGGGGASNTTGGTGGASGSGVGTVKRTGGNGGTGGGLDIDGASGGGGGGAAGPSGAGANGGAGAGGLTGGGGGGGANGGSVGSANSGTTGGAGGNGPGGSGSGSGGAQNVNGSAGSNGGGGGGGGLFNSGGAGGAGTEWDATHGAGGGGGGTGNGNTPNGGAGGGYGGGGGGTIGASGNVGVGAQGIVVIIYTPLDTTPPTPDPMTFSSAPNDASATSISMTATTATDAGGSTPINYLFGYFACVSGNNGTGGAGSSWQSGTTYTNTGLQTNKCYGYKVQARDSLNNTTASSSQSEAYTAANVPGTPTLGTPTATTLTLTNTENGNPASNPTTKFAASITATSPTDSTWLNKYIDSSGNPTATETWLSDAQLDNLALQGLVPNTSYSVKIAARNESLEKTASSTLATASTFLLPPNAPGVPTYTNITINAVRVNWTVPAGGADSYKVERCQGDTCTNFSQIAAGVTTLYYDDSGLSANVNYRYQVRGTNAAGDGAYSGITNTLLYNAPAGSTRFR